MASSSGSNNNNNSNVLLCSSERDFILEGCYANCRLDGRTCTDYRYYSIITGSTSSQQPDIKNNDNMMTTPNHDDNPPLILSNGSARLISTINGGNDYNSAIHLLCSIKASIVSPSIHEPNHGAIELHVDGISSTSNNITKRNKKDVYDEIQLLLSNILLHRFVDVSSLCIVPGLYVWRLQIDLFILTASAGNIIDSASHVIRAALHNTLLPTITTTVPAPTALMNIVDSKQQQQDNNQNKIELIVDGDIINAKPPKGVEYTPMIVTITIMKYISSSSSQYILILDPTAEEESCCYAQIHVSIIMNNNNNPIVDSMIKTGIGSLPQTLVMKCIQMAIEYSLRIQHECYIYVTSDPNVVTLPLRLQGQISIQ